MELDLSKIKKVFIIGIGGIGISALAKMALSRGVEVLGVNDDETPKTLSPLRDAGAKVTMLESFKELPEADMYVYSDAWIHRGPEIIEKARQTGKPTLSYFEALGEFSKEYKVIAISGTHGKTTTTAMIAEIMIDAGLDPTVIVGSFVKSFGSNFREGKGEFMVVEADEYNRHFLQFHPYIGVVTNIEADHLDVYKDIEEINEAFDQFKKQSQNLVEDYTKYLSMVPKLSVLGKHNSQNAAAALAVSDLLGIPKEKAKASLSVFAGTWRRLEKITESDKGTIIYDDYAHHPTEIKASISALKEAYPDKKITIVFQPHLYSRTKALFDDFAKSFVGADRVVLLPIYFAREKEDESISSGKLAEAICNRPPPAGGGVGPKAIAFTDFPLAEEYLKGLSFNNDDIFVTMGAGEANVVLSAVFGITLK